MTTKRMTCRAFTKAVNEEDRTVEQIVSVFNNVDLGGDRVNEGAFANSLTKWSASGDPIPVYFSHQWDRPEANIGAVVDAKELSPNDPLLDGTGLETLGGLYTKYKIDERPFADQVLHLMKERRLKQASFAYDIVRNRKNSDGTNDLIELDIIEVGPTLLGMNNATTTLSAKDIDGLRDGLEKDLTHTFIASEEDPSKCYLCGKGQTAVAHISRLSTEPGGAKAVGFAGSLEERQRTVYELATSWAQENDIGKGGFFACYLEATFEASAVFMVEGWSDPWGEGVFFEAAIVGNEDGTIGLETPSEVVVEQVIRPKARRLDFSSATKGALKATVPPEVKDASKSDENSKPETKGEATSIENKSEAPSEVALLKQELDFLELSFLDPGGQPICPVVPNS